MLLALLILGLDTLGPAAAATFTVSNINDSGAGSLRQAITDANLAGVGTHTITFAGALTGGTITLASDLPAITNSVTVNGAGTSGLAISGNDTSRVFFVGTSNGTAVTVTIENLTVQNGLGAGGNGGAAGGGGALGAGGGLFVATGANVTVANVSFVNNQAAGGDGASGNGLGGGGGFGGAGSPGAGLNGGAGGPGGNLRGTGGAGGGGVGVGVNGGVGGVGAGGGGASGSGGGTGGGGGFAGGGGAGGGGGIIGAGGAGGAGGFGGGGGAGGTGGVGLGGSGGAGEFGGGSGGSGNTTSGGGGGAGLGGAVFVMNGATLTVQTSSGPGSTFLDNTATGGAGGGGTATAGSALGEALFLMNDTITTFDVGLGQDVTLSQTIAGGGEPAAGVSALVKTGAGRLVLSGANSYTGGTTISAGILGVGADNNLGVASGSLTLNGGTLQYTAGFTSNRLVTLGAAGGTFDTNGNNSSLAGVISGAGALTKIGAGTLTLSGANTYSGGTIVNAGSLQGNSTSLQGDITNNAIVVFDQSLAGTYAGVMEGTGSLVKQNTGSLALTGVNTYTGGTFLNGGILSVGADDNLGNATGRLTFNGGTLQYSTGFASARPVTLNASGGTVDTNGNTATLSGVIGGSGGLTKAGAGTLTLGGTNTYTGATAINEGTLQMSLGGSLASATAVRVAKDAIFDVNNTAQTIGSIAGAGDVTLGSGALTAGADNTSTTQSGVISGTGGNFTKIGTGVLNLTGANTYTGLTTINAGALLINGSITSDTLVVNGAVLGGTGTIVGRVDNSGILAPGNSIGTLKVTGNYTDHPGSEYRVEVTGAGESDKLAVTGSANLGNGLVTVQSLGGAFGNSTTYTILSAGSVGGDFSGATSDFVFLNPTLTSDANNVFLTLKRNNTSFASVGSTPNQRAVAQALDVAGVAPSGDMALVIGTLNGLTAAQARSAYDAIGGQLNATLVSNSLDAPARFSGVVNTRLGRLGAGMSSTSRLAFSGLKLAYQGNALAQLNPVTGVATGDQGLWIQAAGASGNVDGDGNARGYDYRGGGFAGGYDGDVNNNFRAGIALGYSNTDLNIEGAPDNTRVDGYELAFYGRYRSGSWTYKGILGIGENDNQTDRAVTVGGLQRTASADFKTRTAFAYLESAYRFSNPDYYIEPLAAAQWSTAEHDGFTEQGAGALNLVVTGQRAERTRTYLGARIDWSIEGHIQRMVEIRGLWIHDFDDAAQTMDASLSGSGAAVFAVRGVEPKRDAALLGAGIADTINRDMSLYFDYNLELRGDDTSHLVVAGFKYQW